jgi:hypothetical protein
MYTETAKSGNSWSYIDREKYTPGAESQSIEYKPLDTDLFRRLIDKYMDKVPELNGPPVLMPRSVAGGKLKKTRRNKQRRDRKTKMRKRR